MNHHRMTTAVLLAFCFVACFAFSLPSYGQEVIVEEVGDSFFGDVWEGDFAVGVNGTNGNSDNLDVNFTLNLKRETDFAITELLATYFYSENSLGTSTDRVFTQGRQERKLANPNFTWFYMGSFEWDRFKSFDSRVALHTGIGIVFLEDDVRSLKGRIGAGASREFGGANDEWLPELQLGWDWERHLTERTKLYSNVDYFPNLENFADYRLNVRAGFETLLDEALDMRFSLFIFNRFDSTPGVGFEENDLEYGSALIFGF